ncbi:hypothetical protein PGT21_023738 [Puccinia graminis f. sp. tritici]|uniref:Uncharacterized protein n=1 Tax=Puccinia graminis f. sp. tritici TaxID=56615 RepID=A0A5B0QJE5_PUCGR|nr:hypothetical protein PGT21_023738 [Puccinia graminis f. sp. tritici]
MNVPAHSLRQAEANLMMAPFSEILWLDIRYHNLCFPDEMATELPPTGSNNDSFPIDGDDDQKWDWESFHWRLAALAHLSASVDQAGLLAVAVRMSIHSPSYNPNTLQPYHAWALALSCRLGDRGRSWWAGVGAESSQSRFNPVKAILP